MKTLMVKGYALKGADETSELEEVKTLIVKCYALKGAANKKQEEVDTFLSLFYEPSNLDCYLFLFFIHFLFVGLSCFRKC